ncbi:hypothetical protein B0J11DRAFT_141889 [Dendryphion nanum]|uniref:Transmembrane protein n=1 Tax=Dendryphion nanum TaxID=256645 RepID=A0A9P9D726_9PLEO|nr:hypothetical protein B0J11DRAFT_141889 [Dendryphion nanum]
MPPPPVSTARDRPRIASFTPSGKLSDPSTLFLFVFLLAACTRVVVARFSKRRSQAIAMSQQHGQETRKDSASDCSSRTVSPEREFDPKNQVQNEKGNSELQKEQDRQSNDRSSPSPSPSPSYYTASYIKLEDPEPSTFQPIYPWVLPPQPLPGPYDLPLPTLRRHSPADADKSPSSPDSNPKTPEVEEEEAHILPYTRHISTTTFPPRSWVYSGTVTTSTSGWRRNQWVVSGG